VQLDSTALVRDWCAV